MQTGKTLVWVSAGMISLFAFANSASAHTRHSGRYDSGARHEVRGDRREIWRDRAELHKNTGELYKDRAELRRDLRRGAPASEIAQDRSEIRQDLGEIFGDRRDLRGDFGGLRRDQHAWNRYPAGRFNTWDRRAGSYKDTSELYKDRAELRRDLRRGAPASEIAQDRSTIAQDLQDIFGATTGSSTGTSTSSGVSRNPYGWNRTTSNRYNNSSDSSGWWNSLFGR